MKTIGNILLGIWLIATGLITLVGLTFTHSVTILSLLAIVAGAFVLLGNKDGKSSSSIGSILLGAWLIIGALLTLTGFSFTHSGAILAALALVAGIFVVIRR